MFSMAGKGLERFAFTSETTTTAEAGRRTAIMVTASSFRDRHGILRTTR